MIADSRYERDPSNSYMSREFPVSPFLPALDFAAIDRLWSLLHEWEKTGRSASCGPEPDRKVLLPLSGVLQLYIQMRYEWDEAEEPAQPEEARSLIRGGGARARRRELPHRTDRIDETGEQRWHAIGAVQIGGGTRAVLFVVHVYREEIDGQEIVRIISARRADKHDLERYQEQEMD